MTTGTYRHLPLLALSVVIAAGASNQASAFGTQDDQTQSVLYSEFKKLDRNNDKKLSRDEASRDSDISSAFEKADSDHNGTLTADEYGDYKSTLQQARVEVYLDDSTVTAKVKAELLKDNGIKGLSIKVETHKGTVILSGFVDSQAQVRRAVEIASGVRGVQQVKNGLVVKG